MPVNIVATSHGTNNAEGQKSVIEIVTELEKRLSTISNSEFRVHAAYVDVQNPSLDKVLAALPQDQPAVLLPLLLSTGFHTQVDMETAAQNSGIEKIWRVPSLGPSPRLAKLMRRKLEALGWRPGQTVVMAGAGSSRQEGQDAVAQQCALLAHELGQAVSFGFIANIEPKVESALAEIAEDKPVYIANYLLGRGFFNTTLQNLGDEPRILISEPLAIPGDSEGCGTIVECALESLNAHLNIR